MSEIYELPVYPPADVFPMMAADELEELAADIKANGLREPLVVAALPNEDGELLDMLVDGRNRRDACKMADVEPETRRIDATDATAFVLSANIHRRHLSAGQRAMSVAFICPEPAKGGRGKTVHKVKGFSTARISQARTVLRHSREDAEAVLSGVLSLNDAYERAKRDSGRLSNDQIRLQRLREERPDLADKVEAEEMRLDDAVAKAAADAEALRSHRWAFTKNLINGVRGLERDAKDAVALAADYDNVHAEQLGERITPKRLRLAGDFAHALAEALENK